MLLSFCAELIPVLVSLDHPSQVGSGFRLSYWDGMICRLNRQILPSRELGAVEARRKPLISQDVGIYRSNAGPFQRGYKRASYG